jgi:glucose-1-phosphate cytidylyltransferase
MTLDHVAWYVNRIIPEVGGKPILWHILKIYSAHNINEFIICLGYKGYVIKEYFSNYFLHMSDVTFDIRKNTVQVHSANAEPWLVTLVDSNCSPWVTERPASGPARSDRGEPRRRIIA